MTDLSASFSVPPTSAPPMAGHPSAHAEPPAKVTARGLNFYYGEHHALKNINITLGTNRVTAFVNPTESTSSTDDASS